MSLASVKRQDFLLLGIVIITISTIILLLYLYLDTQSFITDSILAIASILLPVFIYYSQRERKSILFEYHIKPDVAVLAPNSSEKEMSDEWININNGNFYLITLKIKNSGNTAITPKDFVSNLTINFREDTEIVVADVTDAKPSNRELKYTKDTHRLLIEPVFLNSKNFIELSLLLKGNIGNITVNSEIKGTRQKLVKR